MTHHHHRHSRRTGLYAKSLIALATLLAVLYMFDSGRRDSIAAAPEAEFSDTTASGLEIVPASGVSETSYYGQGTYYGYGQGTYYGYGQSTYYGYGQATYAPVEPSCVVSATPNPLARNGTATLTWSSVNATSMTIDTLGPVAVSGGSTTVSPSANTSYGGSVSNTVQVPSYGATTRVVLTSGGTWTRPANWNSANNSIECIGGGGGGGRGGGGGGGGYAKASNVTAGATVSYAIGGGGAGTLGSTGGTGGTTSFGSFCAATGGTGGSDGTVGGAGGAGGYGNIGSLVRTGGAGSASYSFPWYGGAGGGAAGPNGAGVAGSGSTGGAGDAGYGGPGGAAGTAAVSPLMGGNGNGTSGGVGGNGYNLGGSVGTGGGGGGGGPSAWYGGTSAGNGGVGGWYGGGGGGGGQGYTYDGTGGSGRQGIIVITYVPVTYTQTVYNATCPVTLTVNTPTSALTVNGASSQTTSVGESTTFEWSSSFGSSYLGTFTLNQADACGNGVGPNPSSGGNSASGSGNVTWGACSAGRIYTYSYRVTNSAGYAVTSTASVTVNAVPACTLSVTPSSIIRGQNSSLSWTSTNSTSGTTNPGAVAASPVAAGSRSVSPTVTTTYTGTFTGPTGTAACTSATLTVTCSPIYQCSGQQIQYLDASCNVTNQNGGAPCASPSSCVPGQAACVNPQPVFIPGTSTGGSALSGDLEANPQLVREGTPAKLFWNVSNIASCTVTGTNGETLPHGCSGNTCTAGASGQTTANIFSTVVYSLRCNALGGVSPTSFTHTVTVLPSPEFEEQ